MKFIGSMSLSVYVKHNGVSVPRDYFFNKDPINGSYEIYFGELLQGYVEDHFPKPDDKNTWQTNDRKIDYALENPPPKLNPFSFIIDEIEYVMVFYA